MRSDTLAIRKKVVALRSETMKEWIYATVEVVVQAASSPPHLIDEMVSLLFLGLCQTAGTWSGRRRTKTSCGNRRVRRHDWPDADLDDLAVDFDQSVYRDAKGARGVTCRFLLASELGIVP